MALKYGSPEYAGLTAKLATEAGQAIKRERARQEQAQAAAQQRAQAWELQKMEMNSQQDFAHEMRLRQASLDKEARAREWDVEKMEIRSRLDFAEEEKERQRIISSARAKKVTLEKHKDELPPEQYESLKLQFDMQEQSGQMATATAGALAPRYPRQEEVTTLTPEESFRAERVKAGLLPRASSKTVTAIEAEVDVVSDLLGRGEAEWKNLVEAREEGKERAAELGLDYDTLIAERLGQRIPVEVTPTAVAEVPTVSTEQEYAELPSGTQFYDPNGQLRVKP